APEVEKAPAAEEEEIGEGEISEEKEVPEEKLSYEEKGIEQIPQSVLQELGGKESWPPSCYFISDSQGRELCKKCKALSAQKQEEVQAKPYSRQELSKFKGFILGPREDSSTI
ncbi:MAG: hypothetical protein QMC93_03200, partial [Patescibacteria group bacterium]|nr:hypothetical protein [Patescibacteria group bacterium]